MSELTKTEYKEVREIWDSVTSREDGLSQVLAYWTKKCTTLRADNARLRELLTRWVNWYPHDYCLEMDTCTPCNLHKDSVMVVGERAALAANEESE